MNTGKTTLDGSRLTALLEAAGYEPGPYSGRGMFGRQCVSIRTRDTQGEVFAALMEADGGEGTAAEAARTARTDSMGLGMVVYWPSVGVGEDGADG